MSSTPSWCGFFDHKQQPPVVCGSSLCSPTCLLKSSCLGWAEVQVCPLHKTSNPYYCHGDVYCHLLLQWGPRAGSQMLPSVPLWAERGAEDGIHHHHSQNVLQKCHHWLRTRVTPLVRVKGGTKEHIHDTTQLVLKLTFCCRVVNVIGKFLERDCIVLFCTFL